MRVLQVTGDFVKTGGMDRANYALALYMAQQGVELHLAGYRAAEDLLAFPNVHFHQARKIADSYTLSGPILDRLGRKIAAQIAAQGGRVLVNGANCDWPDINWVHHVHAVDCPPLAGGILRRLKVGWQRRKDRREEKIVIPRAAKVITTCHRTKQDIQQQLGVPAEKIEVVYMGVDGHLFRPATPDERKATRQEFGWPVDRILAAFVGALGDRRKGFDTLFAAWERLCADPAWDADLVVVGRGMELPRWKALAQQRGLADRIHFMGFVKNLPGLLAACDAHVLPSRYEGYSLSTQEALSCGIPAFVTQTAGIAERYPEALKALLIKDPEDAGALVEQLKSWRQKKDDCSGVLKPLSESIRSYSWNDMARRIFNITRAS